MQAEKTLEETLDRSTTYSVLHHLAIQAVCAITEAIEAKTAGMRCTVMWWELNSTWIFKDKCGYMFEDKSTL